MVLVASAGGNGEEGIGGDSAFDACPSDRVDMTGDVGDDVGTTGDRCTEPGGDWGDRGERGEGDDAGATTLFCESESGDGFFAGRAPGTEGPADGCGIGELVDDALEADRDLLVNAFKDALCEIVLPSPILRKHR